MRSSGADHDADSLGLVQVAALDAALTSALPHLRERRTLLELAALGWRRGDLVDALEALACEPTMPSARVLAWVREHEPATRELALFVRAQLGVGPAQTARVRALAARIADPIARDLVLAHLDDDVDATTHRLLEHWRTIPHSLEWLPVDLLLRASAALCASRATTRRTRLAPAEAFASHRRAAWPRAMTREAHAIAYRLLPGLGVEAHDQRWPSPPRVLIGSLANVAPRIDRPVLVLPPESIEGAGRRDDTYRAIRAGAPLITEDLLVPVLRWPLPAQLAALDGLADAASLSAAAVDFVEDLARAHSIRVAPTQPVPFVDETLEAALHVLCTHAPERWLTYLADLASSSSPRAREHAARLLGAGPLVGPASHDLLRALELDPTHVVRRAAREARAQWSLRHDARLWTRRVLWSVLRDDAAAAIVFRSLERSPPTVPPSELRRIRRLLSRLVLSPRARERVELAFEHRSPVRDVPSGPSANARLTSTDGRSILLAVEPGPSDRPSDLLARVVPTRDPRAALPREILAFVGTAPSSDMRLTGLDERDLAVRARVRDGGVVLLAADPRVLERIP